MEERGDGEVEVLLQDDGDVAVMALDGGGDENFPVRNGVQRDVNGE